MKHDLILSLGSNIDHRLYFLHAAIKQLKKYFHLVKISSIYNTAPLDDYDQNDFYNICIYFKTEITNPDTILSIIKKIEEKIGRNKDINRPKGPRKIDIDIIFFHNLQLVTKKLSIPHPSFYNRNFVLIPLLEILGNDNKDYIIKYDIINTIQINKNQKVNKIGELSIG